MDKYKVFQLDMCSDGEGWVENSRMFIGTIETDGDDEHAILEALQDMRGEDITGHSRPIMAPGVDLDSFFVDDPYASGEWLEVGVDDDERMPIWGLELQS